MTQHKTFTLAAVALFAAMVWLGNADAKEAEIQCDRTREMVALWNDTNGELGWPPEQMGGCE